MPGARVIQFPRRQPIAAGSGRRDTVGGGSRSGSPEGALPDSRWASTSGKTTCAVIIEGRADDLEPADRDELVAYLRSIADLFDSEAGRALFEESGALARADRGVP